MNLSQKDVALSNLERSNMQAVILAAGKSTRTYPLTLTKPKPLLKVANKTILEYNLECIQDLVSEIIIVVGYKKDMIMNFIGGKFRGVKVIYVEQKEQLGTGHALSICSEYINEKFVLMMGDDIYSKEDIKNCSGYDYSILVAKSYNPENFGAVIEKNGILQKFIEKPKNFVSDIVSTACYSFEPGIFGFLKKIKKSGRGEFELPDAVILLSKNEKFYLVRSTKWIPIVYPWDLLKADKELRKNKNLAGEGSIVKGKVMNSSIGNNCKVYGNVANSIIMDNSFIREDSSIEDSVIGENVKFSGKIESSNNVFSDVNRRKIQAKRIGAIVADNVVAENVVLKPGVKIWPNKKILNMTVTADIT